MILREPFRLSPLAVKVGDIVVSEDLQLFEIALLSDRLIGVINYAGKRKPTQLLFMGVIPDQ